MEKRWVSGEKTERLGWGQSSSDRRWTRDRSSVVWAPRHSGEQQPCEQQARREQGAEMPGEALPTQTTPRQGENSIASCSSRPPAPLSAAQPPRGNSEQRLCCPLGGSSRSWWLEASVASAAPLGADGAQRWPEGRQRTEPPKARHRVRPAPGC